MISAVDTNILIALWDEKDSLNVRALKTLDLAYENGSLVVCGPVFAELLGGKGRTVEIIEEFLNETSIGIDWTIDEPIWRSAANAFQRYAARRRRQGQHEPRRLVTDFIVGAHAVERGFPLLTFDDRLFKKAFPTLRIIAA